jgi:hypothetical protein
MGLSTTATLRKDLSQIASEYDAELAQQGFIGDIVAPINKVEEPAASYPIITRENFLKKDDDTVSEKSGYNFIESVFDSGSYDCEDRGLSDKLYDKVQRRYSSFLDCERARTIITTHKVRLNREYRISQLVMNTSIYTPNNAATSWATAANADPASDIETGIEAIVAKTGISRSRITLICPRTDFKLMCATAAIKDQVKYTFGENNGVRPAVLKPLHLATILEIGQVLVPELSYDTAPEGQTESLSKIWGSGKAMLAVLSPRADAPLEIPGAWRTMLWSKDSPVFPVVERYYDDNFRAEILRVRANTDEVATAEANLLTYMIDTLRAS